MSKHTIGPWFVEGGVTVSSETGRMIANMAVIGSGLPYDEHEANARLIAAAPVMLTTLETIHNWLVCAPIATPEDMAQSFPDMEKLIALALDIAK